MILGEQDDEVQDGAATSAPRRCPRSPRPFARRGEPGAPGWQLTGFGARTRNCHTARGSLTLATAREIDQTVRALAAAEWTMTMPPQAPRGRLARPIEPDHAAVDASRLELARRLSADVPSWGIWKNVSAAVSGTGDIDSVVLADGRAQVEKTFTRWAIDQGVVPVFRCDHAGGLMGVLVAVDRKAGSIVELDLTLRKTYRGSTLFHAGDVVPLLDDDPAGFRRLRPGAEGVLLLFHNGVRPGGRPNREGLAARHVVDLLARDPSGLDRGVALFASARRAARRAARATLVGRWDRAAVLTVELAYLVRALLDPRGLAGRVWFRAVVKRRCPIIRVAYAPGRALPADVDGWLRETAATHSRLDDDRRSGVHAT